MATTTKPCKKCGRTLSTTISLDRGYGPVCWEKEGKFLAMPGRNQELAELKRELAGLKAELRALKAHGFSNFKSTFQREPFPTNNQKGEVNYLDPLYGKAQEKTLAMAGGSLLAELKDALPATVI